MAGLLLFIYQLPTFLQSHPKVRQSSPFRRILLTMFDLDIASCHKFSFYSLSRRKLVRSAKEEAP